MIQNKSKASSSLYRINQQITAEKVRVVDQDGNMLGVMSVDEGVKFARNADLDLVEVSPNANPPVCKIANYGKMKYELQKKAADSKKKQKVVDLKEIKMTINIGKGDYDVKIKHAKKFIEKGDKVKVSIRMKGREITHREIAEEMMKNILLDVEQFAKAETNPRLEGMQMVAILVKK